MRILHIRTPFSFSSAAMLKIAAGAASESANVPFIPGMAHLLEHLLFKREGLRNSDPLTELGVDSNAYTDYEKSAFHFACASQSMAATRTLVQMVFTPSFTHEQVIDEIGMVISEMRDALADPEEFAEYEFRSKLFNKPNYSTDILGTQHCLRKLGGQVADWYHREFYKPANAVLVVAGNRSVGETIEAVRNIVPRRLPAGRPPDLQLDATDFIQTFPKPPSEHEIQICGFGAVERRRPEQVLHDRIHVQVLLELAFQQSFDPFRKLYSKGIFNKTLRPIPEFECGYRMFALQQIAGDREFSNAVKTVTGMIAEGGFRDRELLRAMKSVAGQIIMEFRNPASAVEFVSDAALLGCGLGEISNLLESVTRDSLSQFCAELLTRFTFRSTVFGGRR